jgi:hypothetical protein
VTPPQTRRCWGSTGPSPSRHQQTLGDRDLNRGCYRILRPWRFRQEHTRRTPSPMFAAQQRSAYRLSRSARLIRLQEVDPAPQVAELSLNEPVDPSCVSARRSSDATRRSIGVAPVVCSLSGVDIASAGTNASVTRPPITMPAANLNMPSLRPRLTCRPSIIECAPTDSIGRAGVSVCGNGDRRSGVPNPCPNGLGGNDLSAWGRRRKAGSHAGSRNLPHRPPTGL